MGRVIEKIVPPSGLSSAHRRPSWAVMMIWRLPPPRHRKGTSGKPIANRYQTGTNPIDTDSIALIVKSWTGLAGFDAAAFAGHSLRRGAISSGVAQGVHIARLKQFSGQASLKSLEEYVELDELRQNHPLKDIL
jgi:hypothetical protein